MTKLRVLVLCFSYFMDDRYCLCEIIQDAKYIIPIMGGGIYAIVCPWTKGMGAYMKTV